MLKILIVENSKTSSSTDLQMRKLKSCENKFNSEHAGDALKTKQRKLFKTMNITQQLKLFASILDFAAAKLKVQLQVWHNADNCRNSFPKFPKS